MRRRLGSMVTVTSDKKQSQDLDHPVKMKIRARSEMCRPVQQVIVLVSNEVKSELL